MRLTPRRVAHCIPLTADCVAIGAVRDLLITAPRWRDGSDDDRRLTLIPPLTYTP